MDVLKDVKKAEAEAEKIEAEYRQRAAELLEQTRQDWGKQREKSVASTNKQLEKYRTELLQELIVDKKRVHQEGKADLERLQKVFEEHHKIAVAKLIERVSRR